MMRILVRLFVKNSEQVETDKVRKDIGNLTALVGIINNIFLCIFKFIAGTLSSVQPSGRCKTSVRTCPL